MERISFPVILRKHWYKKLKQSGKEICQIPESLSFVLSKHCNQNVLLSFNFDEARTKKNIFLSSQSFLFSLRKYLPLKPYWEYFYEIFYAIFISSAINKVSRCLPAKFRRSVVIAIFIAHVRNLQFLSLQRVAEDKTVFRL